MEVRILLPLKGSFNFAGGTLRLGLLLRATPIAPSPLLQDDTQ
jgi:hypothetical protein